jgi:hypothetical protein
VKQFQKLQFKPGINKEVTQYGGEPFWYDSDYVRFRGGHPEMVGGWTISITDQLLGKCRSMFAWTTLSGINYIALGTHLKYYAFDGGQYRDITPIRKTTNPLANNPIATVNLSGIVTITDTSHGASVGDYVTISGAAAFNGLTVGELNQEFEILTVPGANTYTVDTGGVANATSSGGGAVVVAEYQIAVGLDSTVFGGGWGAGPWSRNGWGDGYDTSIEGASLRIWSQSNYGEDLIFCPRDLPIYYWVSSTPTVRGVLLSGISGATDVPSQASEVLVTTERHVVAFGCTPLGSTTQDKLLVRWASSEDYLDWTPDQENSAGDLRIPLGAQFITHLQTQREILIWTESSMHSMNYVGAPFYYGMTTLSSKTTIMGPKAKAASGDTVFWMGNGKFYLYDGRISAIPCSVEDYVFTNFNYDQKWKTYCSTNTAFNEVTWFYASASSSEVDRYVSHNYVDNLWYVGTLARTAWLDRSVYDYPAAVSTDGYMYFHEFGMADGSTNPESAISAYIESSPFEIGSGEMYMFIDQIIPDLTFRASTGVTPTATVSLIPRRFPGSALGTTSSSSVAQSSYVGIVEQFTELLNVRVRAHQATFKISSSQANISWRHGTTRLRVRPDGRK